MNDEVSKTPWFLSPDGGAGHGWPIHGKAPSGDFDVCPAEAYSFYDAKLIVKAVNAHEALKTALERALNFCRSAMQVRDVLDLPIIETKNSILLERWA